MKIILQKKLSMTIVNADIFSIGISQDNRANIIIESEALKCRLKLLLSESEEQRLFNYLTIKKQKDETSKCNRTHRRKG